MDTPTVRRSDSTQDSSRKKVTGTSESRITGLSTLPEKRPTRRLFGLLRGKREPGAVS